MRIRSLLIGVLLGAAGSMSISALPADAAVKPVVSSISVTQGPAGGGTVLTVTGKNFTRVNAVKFGAGKGTHLSVKSRTKLTITSPKHTAGRVDVRVTTAGGTSAVVKADRFLYVAPPTITSFTPAEGATSVERTWVTFKGKGLDEVTKVTVDGQPATFGYRTDTKTLGFYAPFRPAGPATITLTTPGGSASAGFRYLDRPTVTSSGPGSGPVSGGTVVTIDGTNLSGSTVTILGRVFPHTYDPATGQITLTMPAVQKARKVGIFVTNGGGLTAAYFTYTD
ncbi:IPT/TIG domain-containing protein [Kineosporia sp. J2-2]|uniref:IPT/TIG domain-containing protein n=1 Tax=Kineosporia corallincola TaxID=2835133 RepID=A0ABS5T9S5_9ACTN|nr:IPT/TIG domain-containing protein [Kineosporia corallincola]MBT0767603.1 IPT/TIG domain-containing protein [Kineosporia corallincola]